MALNFNDVLRIEAEPPSATSPITTIGVSGVSGTPTGIIAAVVAALPSNAGGNKTTFVKLLLRAHPSNTGIIYISNNNAETNTKDANTGWPLEAGAFISVGLNPSQTAPAGQAEWYAVGSDGNQKLAVIAVSPVP